MSGQPPAVGPIDHVALVVRSLELVLPRFAAWFGLEPDAPPRVITAQGVRLCFLPSGPSPAARLELVEPVDPQTGVARFLAARGEGLHHVCFRTPDIAEELSWLSGAGAELVDDVPRAGADGRVAFVHPRALAGVLWELLEADS